MNNTIAPLMLSVACCVMSSGLHAATNNVTFGFAFFSPNDLTIEVGDTVVWSNQGGTHTVTGTGTDPICGPDLVPISCSRTFDTAGDFPYICTIGSHAAFGMTGVVRVAQAPITITPAILSEPTLTPAGDFEFTVSSTANQTNVVQATTNAANPSAWTPIATLVPTNATFEFTDTNQGGFPIRFYRVVQPE